MKKYNCTKERVPFYFRYFGRLLDKGEEKVHARDVADELGFKSANSIVRDFNLYIENAGNIKYGYNNYFMYNSFKKLMDINDFVNVGVIGESMQLFDSTEASKRGFIILDKMDKIDSELIILNDIRMLIITDRNVLSSLSDIPSCVEAVINFTGTEIVEKEYSFYIVNMDILEILANAWYFKNVQD